MKKKLTILLVLALLVATALPATALAGGAGSSGSNGITTSIYNLNALVGREIDKALAAVDAAYADYTNKVNAINLQVKTHSITELQTSYQIASLQSDLDNQINKIMSDLQKKTTSQTDAHIRAAYNSGIQIVSDYITVNVHGNIYYIDPLRIIGH